MRDVNSTHASNDSITLQAATAKRYAELKLDTYSDYGVGAVLVVDVADTKYLYGASNINLSGMEYKVHAEQMAAFQALLDIKAEITSIESHLDSITLERVVVVTTESDLALRCGHCFQVLNGLCSYLDSDPHDLEYIAARQNSDNEWELRETTLAEQFEDSYVDTREVNQ